MDIEAIVKKHTNKTGWAFANDSCEKSIRAALTELAAGYEAVLSRALYEQKIRQLEAGSAPEGWSITRQGDWITIIQPDKKGVKLRLNQTNHHGADATLYRLADTLLAAAPANEDSRHD